MAKTVNFTSFTQSGLPNINKGQNWVNDRQRRFHSEPRRVAGKPTVQGNGNALAFPIPQDGHLVSRNNGNGHHGKGSNSNFDLPRDGRRLQSLPPNKPKKDEFDSRQIRSAPDNDGPNGGNMAGGHQRSRASDKDTSRELPHRTHGKATRCYEETYLRSNKFASSWAQVRADNPAFNDLSPDGSPLTARKFRHKDQSPDSSTKVNSTRDSSPSNHEDGKKDHKKSGVPKDNRGRTHHKTRTRTKLKFADENNNGGSPGRASNGEESETEKGSPNTEQRERKVSRKKEWVDTVVVPSYEKPPPKYVGLRYLDSLTFKPSINTGKDVFETYVVKKTKRPRRENTADTNLSLSENEEGYESPMNGSMYSQDESEDNNSQERPKKEPFLNRREAIKYIKMNNVYGSDAYKNQRKEWFIQKFSEAQETKAKYEAEQKREEKRKRQEELRRQKVQLNYVRKKFRKEQEHRFRTQYVTARVLEYEQVNRHVYGLPEDYLDLANEINRTNTDDEASKNEGDNIEKEKTNGSPSKGHKNPPQKPVDKSSPPTRKGGQKTKSSPTKGDVKKKKKEEEAMAALEKVRENQRNWYSDPVSPTADSGSHASHATSGYESEKHPSDHGDCSMQRTETNTVKHDDGDAVKGFSKNNLQNKTPAHNKNTTDNQAGQNRLDAQKSIYASENGAKAKPLTRQQVPKQKTVANTSTQNKNIKDATHQSKQGGTANKTDKQNIKSRELDSHATSSPKDEISNGPGYNTSDQKAQQPRSNLDVTSKPIVQFNHQPSSQTDKEKNDSNSKPDPRDDTQSSVSPGNTKEAKQGHSSDGGKLSNSTARKDGPKSKPETENIAEETRKSAINNKQGANSNTQVLQTQQQNNIANNNAQDKSKQVALVKDKQQQNNNSRPDHRTENNANTVQNAGKEQPSSKQQLDAQLTKGQPSPTTKKPATASSSNNNIPKSVPNKEIEDVPHQLAHQVVSSNTNSGPRKDSVTSNRTSQHPQCPPKKNVSSANARNQPIITINDQVRRKSRADSGKPDPSTKPQAKKESVADRMFNIKAGPAWDPHKKTPKMEGIDTIVLTSKDKKGREVRKRKDVTDVVKEADNLLKVKTDPIDRRGSSRQRRSRAVSPDLTLGSDFDVDEEDELEEDDIYERLRRKYNIAIDSDEEDV